jgi:hypothetical protein
MYAQADMSGSPLAEEFRDAVQPNGYCVLAWKSQGNDGFASRPLIRALGSRGEVLTELHPGEHLDTTTLASINLDEPG